VFPIFHDGGDAREENPPTDTLAFGLRNEYTSGKLPFFALPTLGGTEQHRGFIAGRFRGRASWLGAVEYRFWFLPRGLALTRSIRIERVGAALFYEAGAVSDRASALFGEKVQHTYGVSLRLSIDRTNPLRFDFGFSDEGMEFSLGYGLSF
jgi:outer membrane protein assembly factor BamA